MIKVKDVAVQTSSTNNRNSGAEVMEMRAQRMVVTQMLMQSKTIGWIDLSLCILVQ